MVTWKYNCITFLFHRVTIRKCTINLSWFSHMQIDITSVGNWTSQEMISSERIQIRLTTMKKKKMKRETYSFPEFQMKSFYNLCMALVFHRCPSHNLQLKKRNYFGMESDLIAVFRKIVESSKRCIYLPLEAMTAFRSLLVYEIL